MFGLKQFRRKQLFNFTLTELILLILFILLFFLLFKILDLNKKNIICETEKDTCETTLTGFQNNTGVLDPNDLPSDMSICSTAIRDKNLNERELLEKITKLELELEKLRNELDKFHEATGVNNAEDVAKSDEELIEIVKQLKKENSILKQKINNLENKINNLEDKIKNLKNENKTLLDQLDQAEEELKKCVKDIKKLKGEGVGLPPCWPKGWIEGSSLNDDIDQGEHIFTMRLTEQGIIVEKDYPLEKLNNQYNFLSINPNMLNKSLNIEDFNFYMAELLKQSNTVVSENNSNITLARECRHWSRVFDETPDDNKPMYKKLLKAVEGHFRVYKWDETYQDYLEKYKDTSNE